MTDAHDRRLARGLQAGEAAAWSALYEAHFDRVWRVAARLIGPDAAAVADVVQETFLAAARSARQYDPQRGSLWLWLAGIARNHVGDYFRARRRDDRVKQGGDLRAGVADQWTDRLTGNSVNPPEAYGAAEAAGLVRAALVRLPDEYQAVLTARYCEGTSVEDIARDEGCSVEALRSRLARARRAFRAAFTSGKMVSDTILPPGASHGHE